MNRILVLAVLPFFLAHVGLRAATPEEEKAFTERYKTAFEGKDTTTLYSFLYTEKANPKALEFYKMMVSNGAGEKITKIELVPLTPAEVKKADETMTLPGGGTVKLPFSPTHKLKIAVEHKGKDGTWSSTRESFLAEKDGKLVIPVPVDAK
jgi:hypothetical protein